MVTSLRVICEVLAFLGKKRFKTWPESGLPCAAICSRVYCLGGQLGSGIVGGWEGKTKKKHDEQEKKSTHQAHQKYGLLF
jgi:hypothetical protein